MQLPWDEHFIEIVVPAWQEYLASEAQLTEAITANAAARAASARYNALRQGGSASFYVHHFAEIVLRARPHWLPNNIKGTTRLRNWLAQHCTMLRPTNPVADVSLLKDVAEALKHSILTQQLDMRDVSANDAVLIAQSGYGQLAYGEGKYGGIDQVLILANSGTRALSSVLQNVIDAWRRAANLPLPVINAP